MSVNITVQTAISFSSEKMLITPTHRNRSEVCLLHPHASWPVCLHTWSSPFWIIKVLAFITSTVSFTFPAVFKLVYAPLKLKCIRSARVINTNRQTRKTWRNGVRWGSRRSGQNHLWAFLSYATFFKESWILYWESMKCIVKREMFPNFFLHTLEFVFCFVISTVFSSSLSHKVVRTASHMGAWHLAVAGYITASFMLFRPSPPHFS